jgi:hypothetical protein
MGLGPEPLATFEKEKTEWNGIKNSQLTELNRFNLT